MTTQIQLFETQLCLVSIPRTAYPKYAYGVLRLLHGSWREDVWLKELALNPLPKELFTRRSSHAEDNTNANTPEAEHGPEQIAAKCDNLQEFINVTFTPIECSVICPTELLDLLWSFEDQSEMQMSNEQYTVLQVDGDGLDTGSRVFGITAPLSAKGIPIFFLATYFSDSVLVPSNAKDAVIEAIQERGYEYSASTQSYVIDEQHDKPVYSQELVTRTFDMFSRANVRPQVDSKKKLLLTGSRYNTDTIYLAITRILLRPPAYFSITIKSSEISFLVDSTTSEMFPPNTLLGSPTEFVVPVMLDLRSLPEESTGIVSGVASRIMDFRHVESGMNIHMSYLSTVKSGLVLVSEEDAESAVHALNVK